jgi:hypothetical protein
MHIIVGNGVVSFCLLSAYHFFYHFYDRSTVTLSPKPPLPTTLGCSILQTLQQCEADALQNGAICNRGVSLEFLLQFTSEFGVGPKETIEMVCRRVVKVQTARLSTSAFSMLGQGQDKYGQAYTGQQSVFVSHSWSESFLSLVKTIEHFERSTKNKSSDRRTQYFYYIDVFVLVGKTIDLVPTKLLMCVLFFRISTWTEASLRCERHSSIHQRTR